MKNILILCLVLIAAWQFLHRDSVDRDKLGSDEINNLGVDVAAVDAVAIDSSKLLQRAFEQQQSDIQVQGVGRVIRLLADDTRGSKHQKFIVKVSAQQTILIAHNIDLAPRVANLNVGDKLEFYGEYEWNNKGGVIHWTHHDPRGYHVDGWLKHDGRVYQ
ncbi:DUF3465 domain-containing protein [Shewanella sp. Isolate11]|uniref:DUF3465 domain-containing protein n=1 Tax=Shewanella sp. Isolate11 TaxID=2908530 RepID=UPI001EFDBF03|nr:DUF3465 domain-containing protein [Shewanella sp. Isolate11]MCG9696027.1 DUF3465 domain-containing protein [Shewanella sp. Isolate11]